MAKITLDESRWPLIEVRYPNAFDDAEWADLIDRLEEILRRDQPFAMINDVRVGPAPTGSQRRLIYSMYRNYFDLVQKNWLGTSIVTSSPLVRGAFVAVLWLWHKAHPVEVFLTTKKVKPGCRNAYAWLTHTTVE